MPSQTRTVFRRRSPDGIDNDNGFEEQPFVECVQCIWWHQVAINNKSDVVGIIFSFETSLQSLLLYAQFYADNCHQNKCPENWKYWIWSYCMELFWAQKQNKKYTQYEKLGKVYEEKQITCISTLFSAQRKIQTSKWKIKDIEIQRFVTTIQFRYANILCSFQFNSSLIWFNLLFFFCDWLLDTYKSKTIHNQANGNAIIFPPRLLLLLKYHPTTKKPQKRNWRTEIDRWLKRVIFSMWFSFVSFSFRFRLLWIVYLFTQHTISSNDIVNDIESI